MGRFDRVAQRRVTPHFGIEDEVQGDSFFSLYLFIYFFFPPKFLMIGTKRNELMRPV